MQFVASHFQSEICTVILAKKPNLYLLMIVNVIVTCHFQSEICEYEIRHAVRPAKKLHNVFNPK